MRLGLTTAAFYGRLETEDAAARFQTFDVDCAEIFLETYSEYSASFGALVRERLGGLPVTSVHPMGTAFENSLFSLSARQRLEAQKILAGVLEAGRALGARIYVYHGRHNVKGTGIPANFESVAPRIGELCDLAADYGITICFENVSWCQMSTPERVLQVRNAYPKAGFVLDIKQAMQSGYDVSAFIAAMGDRLQNVHVCDYDGGGKLFMPGQGTFDFAKLGRQLREAHYDGPVILEPYTTLYTSDEELAQSIAYLRKTMQIASQKCPDRV